MRQTKIKKLKKLINVCFAQSLHIVKDHMERMANQLNKNGYPQHNRLNAKRQMKKLFLKQTRA